MPEQPRHSIRTAVIVLVALAAIGFALWRYWPEIHVITSDKPLPPSMPSSSVVSWLPADVSAAWYAPDFKALATGLSQTSLGKMLSAEGINSFISNYIDPSSSPRSSELLINLMTTVVQAAAWRDEYGFGLVAEMGKQGEDNFRELLAAVCKTNSMVPEFEEATGIETLSLRRPEGGLMPVACFRVVGTHLLIATSAECLEHAPAAVPTHEPDLSKFSTGPDAAQLSGYSGMAEGIETRLSMNATRNGVSWSISAQGGPLLNIPGDPLEKTTTRYGRSTLALTCSASALEQLAAMLTSRREIDAPLSEEGEETAEIPQPDNGISDLLGAALAPVLNQLSGGPITYIWAEKLLPTDYVIIAPVRSGPDCGALIKGLAEGEGFTVKNSSKDPSISYIADVGKVLGPDRMGFRFWRVNGDYLTVTPSQFALSAVMKDEEAAELLEHPDGTLAYVYADFQKMSVLIPAASMIGNLMGSGMPRLGDIATNAGTAELRVLRTQDGIRLDGVSDLPLGFVLHLLVAGYN